jgi:hypothetical protein
MVYVLENGGWGREKRKEREKSYQRLRFLFAITTRHVVKGNKEVVEGA